MGIQKNALFVVDGKTSFKNGTMALEDTQREGFPGTTSADDQTKLFLVRLLKCTVCSWIFSNVTKIPSISKGHDVYPNNGEELLGFDGSKIDDLKMGERVWVLFLEMKSINTLN